MNGDGAFNHQILVDKLAKLNSSQQSIETLSHWCIFHRKKARQVVETWDRQFHHSPRDQRVSFLYLANDILQNSRRKGVEFVTEFWKVLPDALNDVIDKGDDFGRKAALRLVDIWEDRKVFGSRGHVLKEEILVRNSENGISSGRSASYKFNHSAGELLERIVSSYEHVYDGSIDEDALFGRCRTAIISIEKMEEEIGNDFTLDNTSGTGVMEDLKWQHNILRGCVEQLKLAESSRTALQSHLREALHEQELKIEKVREQLQVVLVRYEHTSNIFQRLQRMNVSRSFPEKLPDDTSVPVSDASPGFPWETFGVGDNKQESIPVRYTQLQQAQHPADCSPRTEEEQCKNTAAEVAAKLTASTSSAQMLSYVLSSLASEAIIGGQSMNEGHPSDSKRPKVENNIPFYVPSPLQSLPPPPPFPHPDTINPLPPPPPATMPLMPPLMPTAATTQFIQAAGSMVGVPYYYGSSPLQMLPSLPPYSLVGKPPYAMPPNTFHGFHISEGISSFSSQPSLPATPPLSRQ